MPNTDWKSTAGPLTASTPLVLTVGGYGTVGLELSGTFTGTVSFEGRVGGAWVPLAMATPALPGTYVTSATAVGTWVGSARGLTQVQMRFSTPTSGTPMGDITASGA